MQNTKEVERKESPAGPDWGESILLGSLSPQLGNGKGHCWQQPELCKGMEACKTQSFSFREQRVTLCVSLV